MSKIGRSIHGDVVYKMMEEAMRAASVFGVQLDQAYIDEMFKLISEFDAIKTSMLIARERDRLLGLERISSVVIEGCG